MFEGWLIFVRGLAVCKKYKNLWIFVLIPILLNILIFASLFFLGAQYLTPWFFDILHQWIGEIAPFFRYLLIGIFIYIFYLFVIYFFNTIGLMIGGYFYTLLADKLFRAEQKERGVIVDLPQPTFFQVMKYELKKFLVLAVGGLIVTLLSWLLPFAAGRFLVILVFFLAYEYFDYGFEGMRMPYKERIAWIRGNLWKFFSDGLVVYLLLSIPIIGFLICPICVVGATDIALEDMIKKSNPPTE